MLTRKEMAEKLGVPETRLQYTPQVPRMGNRKQRRKIERVMRRVVKRK